MVNYDPRWLKTPWELDQGLDDTEQIPTAKAPNLAEEAARQWLQGGRAQTSEAPAFDADSAAAQWFHPMNLAPGGGVMQQAQAPEIPAGVKPYAEATPAEPSSHIRYKFPGQEDWHDAKTEPPLAQANEGFGETWASSGGSTVSQPNTDYQKYRENLYGKPEVAAEDALVAQAHMRQRLAEQGLSPEVLKLLGDQAKAHGSGQHKLPAAIEGKVNQAQIIKAAGEKLLADLPAIAAKLGPLSGRYSMAELQAGVAGPEISHYATALNSFAALQPQLHGFRGQNALKEFEQSLGGLSRNPDSLKGSIRAWQDLADTVIDTTNGNHNSYFQDQPEIQPGEGPGQMGVPQRSQQPQQRSPQSGRTSRGTSYRIVG